MLRHKTPTHLPVELLMNMAIQNWLSHIMEKLESEATRPTQNLRHLVGHANLIDSMVRAEEKEAQKAEEEEKSWFIKSVEKAAEHGSVLWSNAPDRDLADDSLVQRNYYFSKVLRVELKEYDAKDEDNEESIRPLFAYRKEAPVEAYRSLLSMSPDRDARRKQYDNLRGSSSPPFLKCKNQRHILPS